MRSKILFKVLAFLMLCQISFAAGGTGIGENYTTYKQRSSAPSTPASTYNRLYFKTDGLPYYVNSAGTESSAGGDVNAVGDCSGGACLDGSSDGGTNFSLYDGTSSYLNYLAGVRTLTLAPHNTNAENLLITFGDNNNAVSLGSGTGASVSINGNAGTATALAANGANCSAGQAPLGVDASGAVESCFTPQAQLDLVKGTYTNTYLCTYTTAGTLLDCNTNPASYQPADADLTTWAGITPGANIGTALAVAVGTAGAPVINGGVLGTPSSGTLTNASGLPLAGLVAGTAESDFIIAGASPFTFALKTLADTKTLLHAAPGTIGGTTPAAITGTTLTASTGDVTSSAGNFVPSTSGKGIDFSANTAFVGGLAAGWIATDGTIPANGDTVQIDTKTYTFRTALTPTEGEVLINGSAANALINLKAAIMHTGTPDTDYKCAAAHATVGAYGISTTSLALRALTGGTAANSYALAVSDANMSVSAATLTAGTAGGSSELLTWYEEGQWTPRYTPSTGDDFAKVTYDVRIGHYTRIGRVVFYNYAVRTDVVDKGTATGGASMTITGLPYSCGSGLGGYVAPGVSSAFTTNNPTGSVPNTNYFNLYTGGTTTPLTVDNIGTGANNNMLYVSGFYSI